MRMGRAGSVLLAVASSLVGCADAVRCSKLELIYLVLLLESVGHVG